MVGIDIILSLALIGPMLTCDRHYAQINEYARIEKKVEKGWDGKKVLFGSYEDEKHNFNVETSASVSETPFRITCRFGP